MVGRRPSEDTRASGSERSPAATIDGPDRHLPPAILEQEAPRGFLKAPWPFGLRVVHAREWSMKVT